METPLAFVRCAHFLSLMFLFGAGTFLAGFAPEGLRAALSARLRGAAVAASLVALLSAVAWLMLEAASMSGEAARAYDWSTLKDVLTSTAFGAVWEARLPLLLLLVMTLLVSRTATWLPATGLAALALVSLGWIGHAAMQTGAAGMSHRLNDGLHLMAAAIWLGSLPPFFLSLAAYRSTDLRKEASTAFMRFSTTGHLVVIALVVTGVINVALTTGQWPWPPGTPYRAMLTAKLVAVCLMIGMAIVNRYALAPRIARSGAAFAALRTISLAEMGLGCVVVALVSLFGLLDPA